MSTMLEQARLEVTRQLGVDISIRRVPVDLIRAGDTVFHAGKARTVCGTDLRTGGGMGRTLFGDSYVLGLHPVLLLVFSTPRPSLRAVPANVHQHPQ